MAPPPPPPPPPLSWELDRFISWSPRGHVTHVAISYAKKPAFYGTFMRIRNQLFTSMRIRILLLIKVMEICDHWSVDRPGLHFEPPSLNFEPPGFYYKPLKILNFEFNADPDPALHSKADMYPDPASIRIRNLEKKCSACQIACSCVIFWTTPDSLNELEKGSFARANPGLMHLMNSRKTKKSSRKNVPSHIFLERNE